MTNLQDEQRKDAKDVLVVGEAFRKSAEHLHSNIEKLDFPHNHMPVYYLYCHAMELMLKAFLRAKGMLAKTLASREYGHKLQKSWDECLTRGLTFDPGIEAFVAGAISLLDPYATRYDFRYLMRGPKALPPLDEVQCTTSELLKAVQPAC